MRRPFAKLISLVFLATCLVLSLTCFRAAAPDSTAHDGSSTTAASTSHDAVN